MKLFLSSQPLNSKQMKTDFKSFAGTAKTVTIITTASQAHKNNNKHAVGLKSTLSEMGYVVNFLDVEFEDPELLKRSNLIVIMGGNPYYLLHHLKQSGAQQILIDRIFNETPVYGISAGILVLMKSISSIDILTPGMNSIELNDLSGLGVVQDIIIPHFDRFTKEGIITAEKISKVQEANPAPLIKLGEFQWLQYKDGSNYISGDWQDA